MKDYLHIYTRVSSRVQDEDGTSLDDQERVGKKLAKELGLRPKVWKEGSASAGKDDLTHRPVLLDLLQEIEKGRVRQLYAWNTDRLSRNQRTWNTIRWKLYDADVMLHTSKGPIDLRGNPQDELLFGILSEISSYDNKLRAERSRMGKLNRVRWVVLLHLDTVSMKNDWLRTPKRVSGSKRYLDGIPRGKPNSGLRFNSIRMVFNLAGKNPLGPWVQSTHF